VPSVGGRTEAQEPTQSEMRIVAVITDPDSTERTVEHLRKNKSPPFETAAELL